MSSDVPSPTPVVAARDLVKSYPPARRGGTETVVLTGISMTVEPGEFVAIVGPSGSGKSTLLYCLAGLEPPSRGQVLLLGEDPATLLRGRLARLRRSGVGFVFQSFNLIPSLSARENVTLPARLSGRRVRAAEVTAALAAVGLQDRGSHRPGELSGGQQQRVAIARVLAARPRVVFADEPTGALDGATGTAVLGLLTQAAHAGSAVVLVTHDLEAAARADRVIVLRDGAIHGELRTPTAAEIFAAVHGHPAGALR
ncbi:ABC transporter ATP-binding protein [Microbacterium sp. ZW T5_56]|uniref:ABC transporter ATP-binding protein n=1 Tax=Microbacterium sp. ZW T5_56 TaxID=3378081 RepID=UPI003851FF60